MELTDKVAVITGASSGIGAAVARNLNEAGVNLVLTGRREVRLVELKKELNHAEILPGDITNPALPDNLIQMALQSFGHCDIVFNNAGTKHAIEALTEGFRMELAKTNIAVAYIEPGLVQTEIFRDWDEFPAAQFDIPNPLQPEDIARVVRFILEQPDHVRIPRLLAIPADQEL